MTLPGLPRGLPIGPEEAEGLAVTLEPWLVPPLRRLLDARFTISHARYDEFVFRLALRVVRETKLAGALREWATADEIVARAGFHPDRARVPVSWMLRHLARRTILARDDAGGTTRFRVERALPELDPETVLAEQRRHDPACLPSYALADAAARDYPAFLRGERSGEEILLAPARLALWTGYFSNDNVLYAVNNHVGAVAVDEWMGSGPCTILELGGGLGSGAIALLEWLADAERLAELRAYRFTELVPLFLRRGQRLLQDRFPDAAFLTFAGLDMNRAFAEQGVAPESVSIVYAVNTLHVAHDLAFTLAEIRRALAPGGQLIVSECVRPWPADTLYPEFVFNLLETFRAPLLHPGYRPNGGFLTPEQWAESFRVAGFEDVRILPDLARIREVFPTFYVAAVGARRPA